MERPTALVLGAAVWQGGLASPALKRRVLHAVGLFQNGQVAHIIGCGGVGRFGPSEAEVIKQICLQNGVPEMCISIEDNSTTTYENIKNALALVAGHKVVIVTDKYHAPRAKMTARHLGLSAITSSPANSRPKLKTHFRELSATAIYRYKFWRKSF
ncbi:MAG TPA: YdcF family protein [Rhodobacteraceae bacterium]|jgi:uncharacterized SAM-binding protein YcdF (DUF218 family)|nr:YdcF family protein [Paracoccaceae bacterium]